MAKSYVYGIRFSCPGHSHDGLIRYVGKAFHPTRRFRRHMNPREAHGRLGRSVAKHGQTAFSVEILEIVEAETREEADRLATAAEIKHIALQNTLLGLHGLNLTIGGDGVRLAGEALELQRGRARDNLRRILKRPEVRQKLTDGTRERYKDPEYLARHRAWVKNRKKAHGYEERHASAMERLHGDPAHKRKISENLRRLRQDPDFNRKLGEQIAISNRDPQLRAKRAISIKAYNTEEVRGRKSALAAALHQDPTFAAKYAEGLKRKHADPEYAAKHAQQTRDRHRSGSLTIDAKIGIHLHWAQKHEAAGKSAAAHRQIESLRTLLAEAAHESRIKLLAQRYLDRRG